IDEPQMIEKKLISEKIAAISSHVSRHKWIQKEEITSITDNINLLYIMNKHQVLLLLDWCNKVIDCLPLDKVELGKSLWLHLTALNFRLQISHYNALLKLYVKNEYDFSPMKLLKDMINNGIHPDERTYETCIEYYCMKGNISEALTLLENMQRMQLPLSESIFNLLLMGYSQSGNIESAFAVLNSMKQKKIKLTTETYAAVMCAYAKLNDIDKIKGIIKACNLKNIHFTNKYILNVIYTLATNDTNSSKVSSTHIETMCQYLKKKSIISTDEVQILLKLVAINETDVVMTALSYICLDTNTSQYKDIMKLILQQIVNKSMVANEIIKLCTVFKNEKAFKELLLMSLYYSLLKNDCVSLPLLRECKLHCIIRPHYFWPLLIKQAYKYDVQGILNVIKIMVNDFNVLPCIDTVTDYVLPFTFGNVPYVRSLLMKYGINESTINNAYVLLMLKKFKSKEAAMYLENFPGKYYYRIIAHDLRHTTIYKNDVYNFVYISLNLIENMDLDTTFKSNNESFEPTFVSMDKQLCDLMIDFPGHKGWFTKVQN
ncbi:Leucine-rich PPR motif-containing protein, mitochondrial, partial [Habropoda laboriosa]